MSPFSRLFRRALTSPHPAGIPLRDLASLGAAASDELENNILPFWLAFARNPATGGFWGEVTGGLRRRRTPPRGVILTSRILWTFSAACRRVRQDPEWLEMATYARDDLLRTFRDRDHGGLIWSADPGGSVRDARKQVYGQTFGLYGLAEYHRATGDRRALDEAVELFRLIEAHARDVRHGGYVDMLRADWTAPEMPASGAAKSTNTILHLIEAYANLYRAWPDPALRDALAHLLEVSLSRMLDASGTHFHISFQEDWTPLSALFSPGHDLEFGWVALDAAAALADRSLLERTRTATVAVALGALSAVDTDDGVVFEVGPDGVVDPDKHWWVQAEAVVAFLDAYEISRDARLLDAARRVWNFIESRLVDRRGGEWFASAMSARRSRNTPKISFWKCPYHNGRACLEIAERAARILNP